MSSRPLADPSERQAALTAGLAFAVQAVLALFANFYVLGTLIEPADASATATNIAGSEGLLRAGIAAFAVNFVLDVVVAWALYILLRRTSRSLSLLAAWFRVATGVIGATALLNLLAVLPLVHDTGYATALEAGQRSTQVMLYHDAFIYGFGIALVFFGVHLLLLGYLAYRSPYVPSVFGMLLALAGFGYLVNYLARILLTGYEDYRSAFMLPTVGLALAGEFSWMFWLLLRGGKNEPIHHAAEVDVDVRA
jgi:Domain of unknown function (DUF4386)